MPEEKRELIFHAFAQADSSTTREYGGTGLGLAICTELVALMNGRLWLESKPSIGGTFYFTASFGLAESPEARRIIAPVPQARLICLQVLVVDDNAVNRVVAAGMLEKEGHQVSLASNGREAVACARRQRFDLILMDVQMPELDGLAATARIRALEAGSGRSTPIVAMTARAAANDRERCLAAGMNDYMAKPVSKEKLLEVIGRMGEIAPPLASSAERGRQESATEFSCARLLEQLDGDAELLLRVAGLFCESGPALMQRLAQEREREDEVALRRTAHTLRGSLGNLAAPHAAKLAGEIEDLAGKQLLPQVDERILELKHEIDTILPASKI